MKVTKPMWAHFTRFFTLSSRGSNIKIAIAHEDDAQSSSPFWHLIRYVFITILHPSRTVASVFSLWGSTDVLPPTSIVPDLNFYFHRSIQCILGWPIRLFYGPQTACAAVKRSVSYFNFCVLPPLPSKYSIVFRVFHCIINFISSCGGYLHVY